MRNKLRQGMKASSIGSQVMIRNEAVSTRFNEQVRIEHMKHASGVSMRGMTDITKVSSRNCPSVN